MYQTLICRIIVWQGRRHHACRFAATVNAKLVERAPDPLVDGVRADPQAHRDPAYQRLIHQSPHIDLIRPTGQQERTVRTSIRHADRAGEAIPPGHLTEQSPVGSGSPLQLPFATRSHPSNEMSVGLRLLWIVLIAMGATFSAGMYLAGLESLSRMISG